MKKILLTAMYVIAAMASKAQFAPPNGSAAYTPPSAINLTAACPGTIAGSIWSSTILNFNASFTLTFHAKFINNPGWAGDGIDVVFKDNASTLSVNGTGGYLGYYDAPGFPNPDFVKSFGVEIDVFQNSTLGDPNPTFYDHLMIAYDANPANVLVAPTPVIAGPTSVEDGNWHTYQIVWVCGTNTLDVNVDQVNRIHHVYNYRTRFTHPTAVTWGFTGGGSASCANELIDDVTLVTTPPCCASACPKKTSMTVTPVDGDTLGGSYPCSFISKVVVIDSTSCWTPSSYAWSLYDAGGTASSVFHTSTSFSDVATLTYPIGGGNGHIKTIITFTDPAGTICRDTVKYRDSVWCNGGYAGQYRQATGIGQISSNGVNIYPNPAGDYLKIDCPKELLGAAYMIKNITGEQIMKGTISTSGQAISVGALPPGVYLIELSQQTGQVQAYKFSKQ
jgi:hypothetical protein